MKYIFKILFSCATSIYAGLDLNTYELLCPACGLDVDEMMNQQNQEDEGI